MDFPYKKGIIHTQVLYYKSEKNTTIFIFSGEISSDFHGISTGIFA